MCMQPADSSNFAPGPSRTRQSEKANCDINVIVSRFMKTGQVSHLQQRQRMYADVSEIGDYRKCLERVEYVDRVFRTLPAKTRERFGHSPDNFLMFLQDGRNIDEAIALGIVPDPEAAKPPVVDEVPGPGVQHRGADGRFESPK